MKTFWGDVAVSDAHVHLFSHNIFCMLASQRSDFSPGPDAAEEVTRILGREAPPRDPAELAEMWNVELNRHGVHRAALIASLPGDEPSVAAAIARFPDRFYGYFMVNPLAAGALERVDGALAAGLQGICFFPAMHRYSMDDPHV